MLNYLIITFPTFSIFALIFSFIYAKTGIYELLNNKPKLSKYVVAIVFLFYILGILKITTIHMDY
jgi:hypothetical protein